MGDESTVLLAPDRAAPRRSGPARGGVTCRLPGVYVHVPFCRTKCTYCAFVSGDYEEALAGRYLAALEREIREGGAAAGRPRVDTIFFGGGTPSLLPAAELVRVLAAIRDAFDVAPESEITVEMNPGTISPEKLGAYREAGVTRASVGVQSFDDAELRSIGRVHTAGDARAAVRMLREAGFDDVSIDLIAGLPYQSHDVWRRNLEEAVALETDHLSLYLLELHPGTRLARDVAAGRTARPDDDLAAEMYYEMIDRLERAGLAHYEISNFARRASGGDRRSRHNEKYWTDADYFGFGVAAHAFIGGERRANVRSIKSYVEAVERGEEAVAERTRLAPLERAAEAAFLGLRLIEGVDLGEFSARHGVDLLAEYREGLEPYFDAGLVEVEGGCLRLTRRGLALSNEVFQAFV